jgi:hypothetical protein
LAGLESPLELAGCVLAPSGSRPWGLIEAVEEARSIAGDFLAIDGPEYTLADASRPEQAEEWVRELAIGLRSTGLRVVVNLNSATPPSWADDLAEGPLFAEQRRLPDAQRLAALSDALLEECLSLAAVSGKVRVDWHLGAHDLIPKGEDRLLNAARRAADGAPLAFVFDRPRRPLPLAEGLDRIHPATLLTIGLHLPSLIGRILPQPEPAVFLHKLGSLVRLALSAAVQKRDFLRRHSHGRPALTRGFLLDRARLVVVPVGLEAAVAALLGRGLCADPSSLDLGRQVLLRLRDVLQRDGQVYRLDACLDVTDDFLPTPWDASAMAKSQLRTAGAFHTAAGGGSMAVLAPTDRPLTAETVVELLRYAWQQTDVVRLRVLRMPGPPREGSLFP